MSHPGLVELLHQFGYGLVLLLLLLEAMGLPLPGETVMIAAALYAARTHQLKVLPLLGAAWAGAVVGGAMGYALGRRYGPNLLRRFGPRIGMTEPRRLLGQYLMQRNGAALVFFGRFITVLRAFASVLAGVNGMAWPRFMLFNVLGGLAWTSFYCLGVYTLGKAITRVAGTAGVAIGGLTVVLLVVGFVFVRSHESKLIAAALRARAAGELPELA